MKRLLTTSLAFGALAFGAVDALHAQSVQFGNLNVAQLNANNTSADLTLTIGAGSTPGFTLRTADSNRGDYALSFGNGNDPAAGILIDNVRQNGRNNNATGDTIGLFYATTATAYDVNGYWVALFRAAQGDEVNMNVNFGYFPYSMYLGGLATNGSETDDTLNNTAITSITGSPGIRVGTEFQNTATAGQYTLSLAALGGPSTGGVLLVSGAKNEDNYALSRANADGTFTIFCHDNGVNGASYEADPVAFVYLPTTAVGQNGLVALGRVNSNASTDLAAGTFTLIKGGTGQWYLAIPTHTESTGVLLVSAEGGGTNSSDNIVSSQWDAANSRWVIESRDLSGATALPTLQDGSAGTEDIFSFAFFTNTTLNQLPTVALTAPTAGATLRQGALSTLAANANDTDGSITKVEFFDGTTKLGEDTTAPYSIEAALATLGSRSLSARATDNAGATVSSAAITVTVAPPVGTGGLFLDGANDYVTFGNNPALGLASFTLETWFRRDGAGVTAGSGSGGITAVPLITKGRGESDGSNVDCNYFFGIDGSGRLAADFEDLATGLNHPATGTTVVTSNVWHHAAVTFDAAAFEWRLYLDGGLEAVVSTGGQVPRSDSIQHSALGSALNSTGMPEGYFLGVLDESRIWNHARSQAQIQAAINHQITAATGLVARWSMSEGSGTSLASTAGIAATGTLTNGPAWVDGAPFNVNVLPSVVITAPANGSSLYAPGNYAVTADAADADGSIAQVEFLRDGAVVGTDTTAPYSYSESNLATGVYSYTARATDNTGATRTSSAVSVTLAFDPANPPSNTALRFDGVDDYVTMGVAPELGVGGPPANGLTLECWFRKEGTGVTSSSGSGGVTGVPLFGKGRGESDGANIDCDYFFGINTSGLLVADFETYPATGLTTGQNYPVLGSHAAIVNNRWYHAAVTYDGATATWRLYLDGVQVGTATAAAGARPRFDSIQHFGIATAMNSTGVREGAFAGRIDEVRVWNFARTAAEIAATKDLELGSAPGLVGRYGLNEAVGTTVGNSATIDGSPLGTLMSAPVWVEGAPFSSTNTPPTIALTAPTAGATSMYPLPFALTADASDAEGTVAHVEFYVDNVKVGEDATAPFTASWTPPAVGTYSVRARAVDNLGAVASSAAVSLAITPNPNQPPVVTPGSPANGATGVGATANLVASLADPEGDAVTVKFFGRKTVPATPGPDFTFIALPDTQYYSENTPATRFQQFLDQTNWIVAQRDVQNIAFVSHMGDIVDDGDSILQQWLNADQAMSKLDNPVTTLRAYGIPFGASPGNHDQSTNGDPASVSFYYNQYFGVNRYLGRTYWGGNYGANNDNNYQLFSASGLDFIILHLEYRTSADAAVIAWADALLKAHPHRRAIVTSHWIIGGGNPAAFGGQGAQIYDGLKNNPNLFLLLCGHIHAEGRRADTYQGRTVYSMLQDYQGTSTGGSGFLRVYRFSPANNRIEVSSYSPTLGRAVNASDAVPSWEGPLTLPYNMQASVSPWIELGSVNVPAGGTSAALNWNGLEAGSSYEWYAQATDGINAASSASSQFATAPSSDPTVTLSSPLHGITYTAPASVALAATAADADGSISRVDFFSGQTKVGSDTTAPYELPSGALTAGTYTFSAVAVDNANHAKLSNLVTITVANRTNQLPSVALNTPADGATLVLPDAFALTAAANDADGAVTKVAFYADGSLVGGDTTAPHAAMWSTATPGAHALTAIATDNDGATKTSSTVNVTVVVDTDGDGLTDDYENANGLNAADPLDGDLDLDGDLLSNRLEYALGTPASVPNRAGLRVLGVGSGADAGKLTLTFTRLRGELTYVVRASDDLKTWSAIATNPGALGSPVTVVDNNTASPARFLQLLVTDGVVSVATTPVGRITYTLPNNAEVAVNFPLSAPLGGAIAGQPAGFITGVAAGSLDNANAGWNAGQLSQAAAPHFVRITRGAAAGRIFPIATTVAGQNTATRLTLQTGGVDLTALGIVPGVDTYELFAGATLASLFPSGTLQSGTAATADTLRVWNGAAWITYFHNGSAWQLSTGGAADTTLVRIDSGALLKRRGATTAFVQYGAVSPTDAALLVPRKAMTLGALLPVAETFSSFALQTRLPGWTSNNSAPASGDHVRLWNGSAWIVYHHNGANWVQQGGGDASNELLLSPGRPLYIVRPNGSGGDVLTHSKPY